MSTPLDRDSMDFLAELNEEFGKKKRGARAAPAHHSLNRAFHANNPQIEAAAGKLLHSVIGFYDWEHHRQWLLNKQDVQSPEWFPEARVSHIVHQVCDICCEVTTCVGNEYIRFSGRKRNYTLLGGISTFSKPTALRRVGEVDGNLIAFGLPDGTPLSDEVEEHFEQIPRCYKCIMLEKAVGDMLLNTQRVLQRGQEQDTLFVRGIDDVREVLDDQ